MKRIGLYTGSFDPIHNGHIDLVRRASVLFDELRVGVFRTPKKNLLFSSDERLALARESLSFLPNVSVELYDELTADYARRIGAAAIVRGVRTFSDFDYEYPMAVANRDLSGGIETILLCASAETLYCSSTNVKEIASFGGDVLKLVPKSVAEAIQRKYEKNK